MPPDGKIEITLRDGSRAHATFVSAAGEAMVVRDSTGDRSIERASLRQVRIADPSRRARNGLLGMLIGAGAGVGALLFLPVPYRTVYKSK